MIARVALRVLLRRARVRRWLLPTGSYAAVILGSMLVASCGQTSYGDDFRSVVRDRGAKAADTTLQNLEWGLCNAITIGSIRRKYIGTDKWPAYRKICDIPAATVVLPR